MYAVIKAGGKQHRVKPGDVIEVELMHAKDDSVEFHPLLVVDDENKTHVGSEIAKAVVTARLVGEQKGEKVKVFKYRNKTGYSRRQGHRQMYTLVEIGEIRLPGRPAAKKAEPKAAEDEAESPAKSAAKSSRAATKAAGEEPAAEAEEAPVEDATDDEGAPAEADESDAVAESGE